MLPQWPINGNSITWTAAIAQRLFAMLSRGLTIADNLNGVVVSVAFPNSDAVTIVNPMPNEVLPKYAVVVGGAPLVVTMTTSAGKITLTPYFVSGSSGTAQVWLQGA
jgi:hypothetical protein